MSGEIVNISQAEITAEMMGVMTPTRPAADGSFGRRILMAIFVAPTAIEIAALEWD